MLVYEGELNLPSSSFLSSIVPSWETIVRVLLGVVEGMFMQL